MVNVLSEYTSGWRKSLRLNVKSRQTFILASLSFFIPLLVRLVPEFLMYPYVVGFDPIGYYIPTMDVFAYDVSVWTFFGFAPFFYILLSGITSIGFSLVLSLKLLSVVLFGFIGLALFFYAHISLKWSSWKSLFVALFTMTYFVSLRVSFDLLRTELALVFLFLVLILLKKVGKNSKINFLFVVSMVLVTLSNQIVAVVMFAIVIATLLSAYLSKEFITLRRFVVLSLPAIFFFLLVLFSGLLSSQFAFSNNIIGEEIGGPMSSTALFGFDSSLLLLFDTVGFFLFCYVLLLPIAIFGFKNLRCDIPLKTWVFLIFLLLFLGMVIPITFFGTLPYRWTLLLVYPLSFYVVHGIDRIKVKKRKLCLAGGIVLLSITLSSGFILCSAVSPFPYFSYYPRYMPTSMLQNTVPLDDCGDTVEALTWLNENMPSNGRLLVHTAFYGWALLTFNSSQLISYGYGDPGYVANQLKNESFSSQLYLVWWVNGSGWYGQPAVSDSFSEIYRSGKISVYLYDVT
ncbi:MAG: hypothetical protein LBC03_01320 [Nitrososphaerota archaeon]|jgi:hypothetical protein|nr:hypothetical protein [Nitrososphaerota archaeon]